METENGLVHVSDYAHNKILAEVKSQSLPHSKEPVEGTQLYKNSYQWFVCDSTTSPKLIGTLVQVLYKKNHDDPVCGHLCTIKFVNAPIGMSQTCDIVKLN